MTHTVSAVVATCFESLESCRCLRPFILWLENAVSIGDLTQGHLNYTIFPPLVSTHHLFFHQFGSLSAALEKNKDVTMLLLQLLFPTLVRMVAIM